MLGIREISRLKNSVFFFFFLNFKTLVIALRDDEAKGTVLL
jgi:hypothetical protein